MTDRQETARRADALRSQLDDVVDQFHKGVSVDPSEYQRILNSLCKTLLQLEYADAA
ncbi:MAG: hypothetical protein QGF53_01325 [Alphaproteobacteria bacterium]|jgi:hypothetical protein|nr:hypothetical protein [Alphaproteobacteria bacterium]